MRVQICGVRGSTPAPGLEYARYGGHTSCVAVSHDGGSEPTLVLDAGTGIRRVTGLLEGAAFRGAILLTHLHWDHTQGLPFFAAADRPDASVRVLLPAEEGQVPKTLFERAMSPPHFPITPDELLGQWRFETVPQGEFEVEGFRVLAEVIPHKGGRTVGYRVTDGASSFAYLPDHGPSGAGVQVTNDGAMRLADGVDVLLHDAQHTAEELERWSHFGHSSADQALALASHAGARRLVLFHHGPNRSDDEVDALVRRVGGAVPVSAAQEGDVIELPQGGTVS